MSIRCRVTQVALFKQALSTLSLGKDPYGTFVFASNCLVVHVASQDQCLTASATFPKEMFSEYVVDETPNFVTSVTTVLDALNSCEAASSPYCRVLLSFPNAHGRFVVEIQDGDHLIQTTILTRPSKEQVLDLRFGDSACSNSVSIRGDVIREVVADVSAFLSDKVALVFSNSSLTFHGLGSSFGAMAVEIPKSSDAVIGFEALDTTLQPRYLMSHLCQAFGTSSGGRGGGGGGGGALGGAGGGGYGRGQNGAGAGIALSQAGGPVGLPQYLPLPFDPSLERITLKVNTERQLQVTHHNRDGDVSVNVRVTVMALSALLDE
jgi:hypothetical protein